MSGVSLPDEGCGNEATAGEVYGGDFVGRGDDSDLGPFTLVTGGFDIDAGCGEFTLAPLVSAIAAS